MSLRKGESGGQRSEPEAVPGSPDLRLVQKPLRQWALKAIVIGNEVAMWPQVCLKKGPWHL